MNIKKILFVDDNKNFLNALEYSFKIKQIDVDLAYNVDEALKKIKEKKYDLICSDYEMGNKNGLDLLEYLRNSKNNVKFIMLTGNDDYSLQKKVENLNGTFLDKGNLNIVRIIKEEISNL